MTPPEPGKSSCHQAPVRVASGDDSDIGNKTSVTNWYECTRCSEPCDLVLTTDQPQTPDTQPSLEEILHQVWHDGYDSVHMIVPQEKTVKEAKQAILAYFKSLVPEKPTYDLLEATIYGEINGNSKHSHIEGQLHGFQQAIDHIKQRMEKE